MPVEHSEQTSALPIGFPLPNWTPRPRPDRTPRVGRLARLEPLDLDRHAAALHAANQLDPVGHMWTYLAYGPFADLETYRSWLKSMARSEDPLFFTIVDRTTGAALGLAAYLRIDPPNGVIEVGHLQFSPPLQRTVLATEAIFLMMRRVFDELGYRRYEWKTDALNTASRAAALRYGFTFEGIFRQATVYKGRNRDTAWFSIVDTEWPRIKEAFVRWLEPVNFDSAGRQRARLSDIRTTLTTSSSRP